MLRPVSLVVEEAFAKDVTKIKKTKKRKNKTHLGFRNNLTPSIFVTNSKPVLIKHDNLFNSLSSNTYKRVKF